MNGSRDRMRIVLLLLIFLLILSLVVSLLSLDSTVVSWTISGLSLVFNIILIMYMCRVYWAVLSTGRGPIRANLARNLVTALLPILVLGLYVFSTSAYSLMTESDHRWIWISNLLVACVFFLLYAIIFPVAVSHVCIQSNAAWRMAGLWPTWMVSGGTCVDVQPRSNRN